MLFHPEAALNGSVLNGSVLIRYIGTNGLTAHDNLCLIVFKMGAGSCSRRSLQARRSALWAARTATRPPMRSRSGCLRPATAAGRWASTRRCPPGRRRKWLRAAATSQLSCSTRPSPLGACPSITPAIPLPWGLQWNETSCFKNPLGCITPAVPSLLLLLRTWKTCSTLCFKLYICTMTPASQVRHWQNLAGRSLVIGHDQVRRMMFWKSAGIRLSIYLG